LFPLATDGFEWVGTPTFAKKLIEKLFKAAQRGNYDEEKSACVFWRQLPANKVTAEVDDAEVNDEADGESYVTLTPVDDLEPIVNAELDELDGGLIRAAPGVESLLEEERVIVNNSNTSSNLSSFFPILKDMRNRTHNMVIN
jgi:hypothetical protein